MYLDVKSAKLLQEQATKLLSMADNLNSWHSREYGKTLRFCDSGTLAMVRKAWTKYSSADSTKKERIIESLKFDKIVKAARDDKAYKHGPNVTTLSGLRSAAPTSVQALQDCPKVHDHFWLHGVTGQSPSKSPKERNPNPTFIPESSAKFAHYGTDPHLGFPLATAYLPLTKDSPLGGQTEPSNSVHKLTEAAQIHFRAWSKSFRGIAATTTIRFFAGDAIAFGHTLQHRRATGNTESHWYRTKYTFDVLALDGEDYGLLGAAPTCFDVIDTSNLVDHLGVLNVILASCPLLKTHLSSTMYTECLVAKQKDRKGLMDSLLCGPFSTVSLLLGLVPIEYWTSATAVSNADQTILDSSRTLHGSVSADKMGQMHCRLAWKGTFSAADTTTSKLQVDAADLASLLHHVYQGMFEHEDMVRNLKSLSLERMGNNSCPLYHRGSFALLIKHLRTRVDTDWKLTMELLLTRIENDASILMSKNYIQELYLNLYLSDLCDLPGFSNTYSSDKLRVFNNGIGSWKTIPAVVCITMVVPRSKLAVFIDLPFNMIGTPPVHGIVQARPSSRHAWQNVFAQVQLSFGNLTPAGVNSDADFALSVDEDLLGWEGTSPLLVCYKVPAWTVLLDPINTIVAFGIQSTPQTATQFAGSLGLEMNVFVSELLDDTRVFITRFHPRLAGHASVGACNGGHFRTESATTAVKYTVKSNVDRGTACIVGFVGRLDIVAPDLKETLSEGATVHLAQVSASVLTIEIGAGGSQHQLHFPAPVLEKLSKTRIARKSSYIEVIVPIADHVSQSGHSHFMYPVMMGNTSPVLPNMPRLNLSRLPILSTTKSGKLAWLVSHLALQFSGRERALRDASEAARSPQLDVRVSFKDSIFSLFIHYTGLQGAKSNVFVLNNPTGGGIHIIIFPSRLLFDPASHTVILDCAVLPLTYANTAFFKLSCAKLAHTSMRNIKVDDDELTLWKEMLPVYAERCRDWSHQASCEYHLTSLIPLSTKNGQSTLCSCGEGMLPNDFISGVPDWNILKKYTTRVAISPNFSPSYVEDVFDAGSKINALLTRCWNCKREKTSGGADLLRCSRCSTACYCSRECQSADWKLHKKVCKAGK